MKTLPNGSDKKLIYQITWQALKAEAELEISKCKCGNKLWKNSKKKLWKIEKRIKQKESMENAKANEWLVKCGAASGNRRKVPIWVYVHIIFISIYIHIYVCLRLHYSQCAWLIFWNLYFVPLFQIFILVHYCHGLLGCACLAFLIFLAAKHSNSSSW